MRQSHRNPDVLKLYAEYLGEVGGEKAHQLLHTHYTVRKYIEISMILISISHL